MNPGHYQPEAVREAIFELCHTRVIQIIDKQTLECMLVNHTS